MKHIKNDLARLAAVKTRLASIWCSRRLCLFQPGDQDAASRELATGTPLALPEERSVLTPNATVSDVSACPPAIVRLAQRLVGESIARASRLSRLGDCLGPDDEARRDLHDEVLLLLAQVQHVKQVFATFDVEFIARSNQNEAALFDSEPLIAPGDRPAACDGLTLEPAAVVSGKVLFRGRCIRHVRRMS